MNVMHIMNVVLHRQKRPPVDGMSGKFRPLCEVRLCFVSVRLFAMSVSVQGCCFPPA